MGKKRVILSDSSLNRYGYRVLTEGINLDAFRKNPVMLYMHIRDEGSPMWGENRAIGHWEDIQIDGDQLSAVPVFDKVDDLSKTIAAKFEAGTFNAASIGILVMETSGDKSVLVAGQKRETVTRCELMEASIVDIPCNGNAVRLYERSTSVQLAVGVDNDVVPALTVEKKMNLKATWVAILTFLGIAESAAESTTLSVDNLEKLNNEMARLQAENQTLVDAKKKVDEALKTANGELETLRTSVTDKDTELATLKKEAGDKDSKIATLSEQVKNLKAQPADGGNDPAPKVEPGAQEGTFAEFAAKVDSRDYEGIASRLKEEGLL